MATASDVKALRERTGAGMLDCKKALDEANGDMQKAAELLRKRGQQIASKKADRTAGEGVFDAYIHSTGKIAVLVELNCETDFVARNEEFKKLAHEIALVVAASSPVAVTPEEVPQAEVDKELEVAREAAAKEGKPAEIVEKILAGKERKVREQQSLLMQPLISDPEHTVQDAVTEATAKLGEKITIGRFIRMDK